MGEGWKRKETADSEKEELKEGRVGVKIDLKEGRSPMANLKEGSESMAADLNLEHLKEDQSPRKRISRAVSSYHPAQVEQ